MGIKSFFFYYFCVHVFPMPSGHIMDQTKYNVLRVSKLYPLLFSCKSLMVG